MLLARNANGISSVGERRADTAHFQHWLVYEALAKSQFPWACVSHDRFMRRQCGSLGTDTVVSLVSFPLALIPMDSWPWHGKSVSHLLGCFAPEPHWWERCYEVCRPLTWQILGAQGTGTLVPQFSRSVVEPFSQGRSNGSSCGYYEFPFIHIYLSCVEIYWRQLINCPWVS